MLCDDQYVEATFVGGPWCGKSQRVHATTQRFDTAMPTPLDEHGLHPFWESTGKRCGTHLYIKDHRGSHNGRVVFVHASLKH